MVALELGDFADCRRRKDSVTAEIEVQWGEGGVPFTLSVFVKDLVDADGKERRLVPTAWNVPISRSTPRDSSPDKPAPGTYWNEATTPDGSKTHKVHVDSSEDVTPNLLIQKLVSMGILRG